MQKYIKFARDYLHFMLQLLSFTDLYWSWTCCLVECPQRTELNTRAETTDGQLRENNISLRSEKIFGWFSELDSPHSKMIKVNINLCKTTSIMWSSIWSLPQQYLKVRTNENIIYLAASSISNIKNISTFSIPTLILSCGLIIISCSCKSGCSNLLMRSYLRGLI